MLCHNDHGVALALFRSLPANPLCRFTFCGFLARLHISQDPSRYVATIRKARYDKLI